MLALAPLTMGCKGNKELTPEEIAAKLASDLEEAHARLRNGKIEDAETIYLRILATDHEHPDGLAGMAGVRMYERDYETAQVLLQRAIAAGNTKPTIYYTLGETFRLRNMHAEAVEPYRQAFEGNSEDSDYGLAYGISLKKSGNYKKAEKVLRVVGELDPNAQFVWTELGDVLRATDQPEVALKIYMKAQNTYASDKMARAGAAFIYEAKGENRKALDEWSAYIRMDCCSEYSNDVAKKKITELKATDAELAAGDAPAADAPAANPAGDAPAADAPAGDAPG